jgi:hypothetical protein
MISIENDALKVTFPDIDESQSLHISFQRTLRIPNDGQIYPLPPGLGNFPLRHIEDYPLGDLESRKSRGGLIMPMFQSDALWINFSYNHAQRRNANSKEMINYHDLNVKTCKSDDNDAFLTDLPMAIKVGAGKINALTGKRWRSGLSYYPQNFLVTPDQPWIDGFNTGKNEVRQFTATPLGSGQSAEEQINFTSGVGGIQIEVYPMRKDFFQRLKKARKRSDDTLLFRKMPAAESMEMGLGLGGQVQQEIFKDEYGSEAWDLNRGQRCFIMILNAAQWLGITGERPPLARMTTEDYIKQGLPWFEYYDDDRSVIEGSEVFSKVQPVRES